MLLGIALIFIGFSFPFLSLYVAFIHQFKTHLVILGHNQWFVKPFLNGIFAVFDLFEHLFHKFINGVFTPIYLDWFAIFVILATYDLISTATVFMSLIGFNVRSHILFPFHLLTLFTTLHLFRDSLEISIDYEWNWQLFMKVVEF